MLTPHDWDDQIPEEFHKFVEGIRHLFGRTSPEFVPKSVWDRLAADGNWDLITKLQFVEGKFPGFGTVVVPPGGFSDDDETHNAVLDWLHERGVNVLNPGLLISRMTTALNGGGDL